MEKIDPKKNTEKIDIPSLQQLPKPVELNCEIIRREYDIASITFRAEAGKTILSWSHVQKAKAYHIYRVDQNGNTTFIAETHINEYEIFLTGSVAIYENIAVRAIVEDDNGCLEGLESYVVTNIQTGASHMMLIDMSILLAMGVTVFRHRYV